MQHKTINSRQIGHEFQKKLQTRTCAFKEKFGQRLSNGMNSDMKWGCICAKMVF